MSAAADAAGATDASISIHATAVAIGETGILIRGPSGSGKSSLAMDLIFCS
jgi:HPr kinase/phosphorylase